MIGVFVTFRYGNNFAERTVRQIAETARQGLRECRDYTPRRLRSIPDSVRP